MRLLPFFLVGRLVSSYSYGSYDFSYSYDLSSYSYSSYSYDHEMVDTDDILDDNGGDDTSVTSPSRNPTPSPTRSPTPSPTRSPTRSPTHSPTRSPTRSPTHSPTPSFTCMDSTTWYKGDMPRLDCSVVAKNPESRCNWKSADKIKALTACPETCGTCPSPAEGCVDSDTWYFKKDTKTCSWAANKPEARCLKSDPEHGEASTACVKTCGICTPACKDHPWSAGGNKDCAWVGKRPEDRCTKKDADGVRAIEYCLATCEAC